MSKEYWNDEIKDVYEGITFKVKQTNPVDMIALITESLDYENAPIEKKSEFVNKCLQQFIWTKQDGNWYPLLDGDGNPRLPEYMQNPAIAFDLFMHFRSKVIMPLFTESKTYRDLTTASKAKTSKK